MQTPLTVTFRNLEPSEAVEGHVRRRFADLGRLHPRIVDGDVVIEAPQKRKVTGRTFKVHVRIGIPGPDINVTRESGQGNPAEDVNLAVNDAFETAGRLLVERKREAAGH
jgi:ribosome-associated translation inhibitor RaiA